MCHDGCALGLVVVTGVLALLLLEHGQPPLLLLEGRLLLPDRRLQLLALVEAGERLRP
jgi:hypothetical protein